MGLWAQTLGSRMGLGGANIRIQDGFVGCKHYYPGWVCGAQTLGSRMGLGDPNIRIQDEFGGPKH